jgi:hemerythrin
MPLIIWEDAIFSVQNSAIDSQHKRLVAMINTLGEAMTSRRGYEIANTVLNQTLDYANYHFQTEEDLMDKFSFPGRQQHKAAHEAFRLKVAQLQQQEAGLDILVPRELLMFLSEWLIKHIASTDKELGLFLLEREPK